MANFKVISTQQKIINYFVFALVFLNFFESGINAEEGTRVVVDTGFFVLGPNVTSTTKREEKTRESSVNIRVVTRDEIEAFGFQNLKDLFMFLENSFEAPKGVDRVYGVRGIIGYANDKIKFLIDGMEFPMMLGLGEGEFPLTLDEVQRIEIVKGPNTSVSGGNSTQATINVIRYNGSDFQGLRTGVALGNWNHRRFWGHYAGEVNEDFNFDLYFNTTNQEGYDLNHHAFGHGDNDPVFSPVPVSPNFADTKENNWNARNRNTPLSDHELIIAANYKDFHFMYRRVEAAPWRFVRFVRNYSDAMAVEVTNSEIFGWEGLDLIFSLESSVFGQQYDTYHVDQIANRIGTLVGNSIEHKRERRLEWDMHIFYESDAAWNLLAGLGGNYWQAEGTEWGGYITSPGEFPVFTYGGDIGSGAVSDEFFPSFTEINDLANWEMWADWKWKARDNLNVFLGGRYVYDYVPDDQLRHRDSEFPLFQTKRELLRDFFPKAALVWLPKDKLAIKLIYQEGFNRPNTFEQFAMQNNLERRGTNKATTAKTLELVFDWTLGSNTKTLISFFQTELKDFMNFVYTGVNFPDLRPGDLIGFHNVGAREVRGIEINFETRFARWGTTLNLGYLSKNKINPDPLFDPNLGSGTGATGMIDNSDHNQQTYPEWTIGLGAWFKPVEKMTVSAIYKTHQGVKNNFNRGNFVVAFDTQLIDEVDYHSLDLVLNLKDVLIPGLRFQLLAQNVTNEDDLVGDALSPVHAEEIRPAFYQAKISFPWK